MKISKELLIRESSRTGFRVEILEKVWHLMNVLEGINAHPFLQERLVLKGGTALNLFVFDLPRLSVDIDLKPNWLPIRLLGVGEEHKIQVKRRGNGFSPLPRSFAL